MEITKEVLEYLYWKKNLSLKEIANELGLKSKRTVWKKFNKFGIPRRTLSQAQKVKSGSMDEIEIPTNSNQITKPAPLQPPSTKIIYSPLDKMKKEIQGLLDVLTEIPEVKYDKVYRENIYIPLPLKLLRSKKREDITLFLVMSDLHIGDSDFLPSTYWSTIDTLIEVIKELKKKFNVKNFNILLNGDIVSGREVYRFQIFRTLLTRGHWQVFLAEILLKDTMKRIEELTHVKNLYLIRGTHETLSPENYMLYLKRCFKDVQYLGHSHILNIAEPLGNYNVLFMHGHGKSDYYPISYSVIRDIWKAISNSDIIVERCAVGHSHWLTTNLELEGMTFDESGGFQRWEFTRHQRPSGMLLYLYYDNEVTVIPIRPNAKIEEDEKEDPALEYKNLKYYGKMLMNHYETIELGREI